MGKLSIKIVIPSVLLLALTFASSALAGEDGLYPNLVPVENPKAAFAEIDPNADFSAYRRVKILDTYVAFRSGWEREQARTGSRIRISASEMERIKSGVADLFQEVFTETLQADDGYDVVDESGDDVLLLRPAIIDLDITAPDVRSSANVRTYTSETGAATIYIELYDSLSGQIVGRAADRQLATQPGEMFTWTNRASNTASARRLFGAWAQSLRNFLDQHYKD